MVAIASAVPDPRSRQPSTARLEWLKVKAEVAQEARAARQKALARRKPLKACTEETRNFRETQQALAEHHRNRRRWEEN
jgi:hypothetical protein